MASKASRELHCAIYTRKSTEHGLESSSSILSMRSGRPARPTSSPRRPRAGGYYPSVMTTLPTRAEIWIALPFNGC